MGTLHVSVAQQVRRRLLRSITAFLPQLARAETPYSREAGWDRRSGRFFKTAAGPANRRVISRSPLIALVLVLLLVGLNAPSIARAAAANETQSVSPVRYTSAGSQRSTASKTNPYQASTSMEARQSAIRSIPIEKLDETARAKVTAVLKHTSVFRRMPVHVVDCDPELYLFLVRHPDVVVNIWQVLGVSQLQLQQASAQTFRMAESVGTLANFEFLYQDHETHVIYGEGSYDGPLFAKPATGRCLLVLKTGYVREPDGRYFIVSRLDTFLQVDRLGMEVLTKTFSPLVGRVADLNFQQTAAFLGSLSKTAEVNSRGVQRLSTRLTQVPPDARKRLATLAEKIGQQAQGTVQQASATEPTRSPHRHTE